MVEGWDETRLDARWVFTIPSIVCLSAGYLVFMMQFSVLDEAVYYNDVYEL